jgi:hypothetical protein
VATSSVDRTAESALQRHEDMKSEQRQWLNIWQELSDYIQPRKGNIAFKRTSAQQQTDRLFDSTAPHANELLAASMQGALTSGAFRWFGLVIRDLELDDHPDVQILLEACSTDMFHAINESNFASESHEVYLDGPCFGTSAILVEERAASRLVQPGSLLHYSLPPGSFCIDENKEGRVDTVFHEQMFSARAAANEFGKDALGKQIQSALGTNSNERFPFLHAIYPREDFALNLGRRLPATKKPYGSLWIDVHGRKTARVSGYDECPIMVPRWTKTTGEIYGRGPGFVALPDIKTLNKAVELKLKAWAKIVDPPLMVRSEAVVGTVQLRSAGLTFVRDMDSIKPLTELGGDLKSADMEEGKIREAIRRMFYADQLQMQEGPQMTAYEVQVRYELMQRILGPTLGRLEVEYLNPYINRVFWLRLRASAKNSPYRKLLAWCKQHGVAMDVEYEGPLAKAQRLQESTSMQRFFQIALPLQQLDQNVFDNVDMDYTIREHAASVGTPAKMLRPMDDVMAIRQARQQAQAKAADDKNRQEGAKAAGALGPLVGAMAKSGQGAGQPGGAAAGAGPVAPLVQALGSQKEGTIPGGSPVIGPTPS